MWVQRLFSRVFTIVKSLWPSERQNYAAALLKAFYQFGVSAGTSRQVPLWPPSPQILAALTRAHEAAPIPARSDADRPAPAGSAALRLLADVDISFSRNWCWQTSAVDAGARAIGADADVGFAWSGRRRWCRRRSSAASYRVIANDRKFRSTDSGGALPRSLSAAAAAARKDQRNLAALTMLAAVTRAREAAPIPARSDADRPAPAGSAALRLLADVDSSFSRN